eukprot:356270-Chlamydomonas_euryale.AAC.4
MGAKKPVPGKAIRLKSIASPFDLTPHGSCISHKTIRDDNMLVSPESGHLSALPRTGNNMLVHYMSIESDSLCCGVFLIAPDIIVHTAMVEKQSSEELTNLHQYFTGQLEIC